MIGSGITDVVDTIEFICVRSVVKVYFAYI